MKSTLALVICALMAHLQAIRIGDDFDSIGFNNNIYVEEQSSTGEEPAEPAADAAAAPAKEAVDDAPREDWDKRAAQPNPFKKYDITKNKDRPGFHFNFDEYREKNYSKLHDPPKELCNDADRDGVQDNAPKTQYELDRHRKMVFGVTVEDMHNTRNGELPGHHLCGDHPEPEYPKDPYLAEILKEKKRMAKFKDAMDIAEAFGKPLPNMDDIKADDDDDQLEKKPAEKKVESTDDGAEAESSPAAAPAKAGAPASEAKLGIKDEIGSIAEIAEGIDIADSYYDTEYLQTSAQSRSSNRLAKYIDIIKSPEDLMMLQTEKTRKAWRRRITDADGDGIEDNEKFSHEELDNFYDPLVFGVAEDINNTHHGHLPGHFQSEFTINNGEPGMHWQTIVNKEWPTS